MAVRGSRSFPTMSSECVLDAIMDLEEFMGRPAWKERRNSLAALERIAKFLDPMDRRKHGKNEMVTFARVMSALGRAPLVTRDVTIFLDDMHATILNIVVFKIKPVNDLQVREFLLQLHETMLGDQMDEFYRQERERHPGAHFFA